MLSRVLSASTEGINAYLVEVEADLNVGLHAFNIVGLADKAVSEARERVNSALKACGIKQPTKDNRRITVNLAPADIKKSGSSFDLPIAVAYMLASEQIVQFDASDKIFLGELALDGSLRPVDGILNVALLAKTNSIKYLFVPRNNALEAASVDGLSVIPVSHIRELVEHLEGRREIKVQNPVPFRPSFAETQVNFDDIRGLAGAKRALLVAAAGGHHLFLSGTPGTGKTMLAQALLSITPPPTLSESLEITRVWSSAGLTRNGALVQSRPFRAPHHSASNIALVGGGQNPRPGEASLAHRGVLFLDEAPEFQRTALEALRQPLESGEIHVARAKTSMTFPARFQLVLAMNPCPCGYYGDTERDCKCSAHDVFRYQKKISGPMLDRIDIQIEVPRMPIEELLQKRKGGGATENMRKRVMEAREIQNKRFKEVNLSIHANAEMGTRQIEDLVKLDEDAEDFLKKMLDKSFVSARGYYRILRVAQTIADLLNMSKVGQAHVAEAFQYRLKNSE